MPALLYVVLLLAALGTSSIDVTSVGGPALCQTHKEDLTSEFGCDANPVPALELHGTALEGTCQGEAYYVIPPRVTFDGRDETGVAELFLWQPVDEFGVQDVAFAKVFCEGGPAISGGGSGGILRIVFIDRDGMGPVLCRYNGANESGCTGTFGTAETFIWGATSPVSLPSKVRYFHEDGWVLLNIGQGSSQAVTVLDPEPVPIPAHEILIDIDWHYHYPPNTQTQEGGSPVALLFVLVATGLIARMRRMLKRATDG
jgi:hypothetical protein